jgi:hypothetical protein
MLVAFEWLGEWWYRAVTNRLPRVYVRHCHLNSLPRVDLNRCGTLLAMVLSIF